jgi:HEAT repeat protein
VIWFCPSCFAELPETAGTCLQCGADLVGSGRDFEAALVGALRHPLHDRRLMAARILGRRRAVAAVPALISAAGDSSDPYLAAEAVRALVAIGTLDGLAAARRLATGRWWSGQPPARRWLTKEIEAVAYPALR